VAAAGHKQQDILRKTTMPNPTLVSPVGKAIETAALRAFEDRLLGDIILPSDHRY